jgi:hypothetical protein
LKTSRSGANDLASLQQSAKEAPVKKVSTSKILAGVLALASGNALACGDVLFRVGHAARYDSYAAARPAAVLLYARSSGNEVALRKGLEKAGHKVTVKSAGESVAPDAGARPYDVVIADLAAIRPLAESVEGAAPKPTFVPVVGSGAESDVRDRYPMWVKEGASLGKYLQAIEKVMEVRMK